MERANGAVRAEQPGAEGCVVVGVQGDRMRDLADVLLAAELAAATGARLVVVATESRWPRALAALSCLSCASGIALATGAEEAVRDEVRQRIAGIVGLVGVDWTVEWASGSCTRALLRYARRRPPRVIVFPQSASREGTQAAGRSSHEPVS